MPIAAVTAWTSLKELLPASASQAEKPHTVLLLGTGGVSIAGLQLAHALGHRTIVTSSSDAKLERAKALGADHVINYTTTPSWHEDVLAATDGLGADVVLETGGAGTLRQSLECVAFGGGVACIGYLGGKEDQDSPGLNVAVLALKRNVTLKGMLNGSRARFEEMLEIYRREEIRPVVDRVFGWEEAGEAMRYLQSGGHFGKVVVRFGESGEGER